MMTKEEIERMEASIAGLERQADEQETVPAGQELHTRVQFERAQNAKRLRDLAAVQRAELEKGRKAK